MNIKNRSLFLFRLFGVNVYLNWSWALVAALQIYLSRNTVGIVSELPRSLGFHIALYLCLFLIVLIHEFGHALACKSVGGRAEDIFLWPLGGVAYVQPPQRAGAMLWSIAAGPLVNVVLLPLTIIPALLVWAAAGKGAVGPDFLVALAFMNAILLAFNMLPFFPLDGGQILRSLLWFLSGRGLSLVIAAIVGIVGAILLAGLAALAASPWLGVMVLFMAFQSYQGLRIGLAMYRMETGPRHPDALCPLCRQHPPQGALWTCPCGASFDTFDARGTCPACGRAFNTTTCPFCQQSAPLNLWYPQNATLQPTAWSSPSEPRP
jgi:Zn-dependent protease